MFFAKKLFGSLIVREYRENTVEVSPEHHKGAENEQDNGNYLKRVKQPAPRAECKENERRNHAEHPHDHLCTTPNEFFHRTHLQMQFTWLLFLVLMENRIDFHGVDPDRTNQSDNERNNVYIGISRQIQQRTQAECAKQRREKLGTAPDEFFHQTHLRMQTCVVNGNNMKYVFPRGRSLRQIDLSQITLPSFFFARPARMRFTASSSETLTCSPDSISLTATTPALISSSPRKITNGMPSLSA